MHNRYQEEETRHNPEVQDANRGERNQLQKPKPTIMIGTKKNNELQGAEKNAWIYAGKLRQNTTEETVISYLKENGVTGKITCKDLNSRGNNKAFKVGVPFRELSRMENPEFWPAGVLVTRFRFSRDNFRREQGATLE